MQCSPQILAQQEGDNSWAVFFKTTYIVLVNLQKVAGGKKFLELLLEAVNYQLPPDKENTAYDRTCFKFWESFEKNLLRLQHTGFAMR